MDSSITSDIDNFFKSHGILNNSSQRGLFFHVKRTFDYKRFTPVSTDLASFLRENSSDTAELYKGAGSECHLDNDTVTLVAILNYENSVAIRVTIFKEKVAAQLRLVASEKIYSKSGEINDLEEEIILSGKDVSLTFTESPDFKVGDRLKGKIEVEYEPYYQIDSSNILSKIVPEFKLIFDKEILGL